MKLFYSLFCSVCLFGAYSGSVELQTQTSLLPMYISDAQGTHSEKKELRALFLFDVTHNGRTKLAPQTDRKEKRLQTSERFVAFNQKYWKQEGIRYVVTFKANEESVELDVFNVQTGLAKTFSKSLRDKEAALHALHDEMHKWLFNAEGIAQSKILFARQDLHETKDKRTWTSSIWEVGYDGKNARKILSTAGYSVTPYAIPGSNEFFFVTYKEGVPKIHLANKKNGTHKPLVSLRGNQFLPTVSFSRNRFAFICDASGRADLFVQPFDAKKGPLGKPMQAYSFPSSVQASPTLSPDGSRIAFVSDKTGTPRVYVINTPRYTRGNKLPEAKLLSKACRENTSPHWSPDGTKIAYSARIDGVRQIVIYDLQTDQEWQVTAGPVHAENPSWAKDSIHLVFNSVDGNTADLYIVDIHEKKATRITSGPGKKHFPSWE